MKTTKNETILKKNKSRLIHYSKSSTTIQLNSLALWKFSTRSRSNTMKTKKKSDQQLMSH